MLKKAVKNQMIEILHTMQEGMQQVQKVRPFVAKKIFFDSVTAIEFIKQILKDNLSIKNFLLYEERLNKLLSILKSSKIVEAKNIQGILLLLVDMIEQEKETCKEILFLPYKASMWDSLESIWRATQDDLSCESFVVPIPYCNRNTAGQAIQWHYEGGQFPLDVPIISFEQYDIAQRRPDVIYIHNPYDEYNRVTSVHPNFYSVELKKHTNMLVYVPYFVVLEKLSSDHFCQVPGVLNADRVIVQSEKVKETYTEYISAEKILAIGSPKFEKVFLYQGEDKVLPEAWQKIAKGRKLILYNTHLSPLIIDNGSVCEKLKYVFSCFEKRDDVCLLWRPHPLSQATMQAMNTKPMLEYLQIIEEYKEKRFGIYDDSMDVHRAIALSDAYYGDMSSLVPMFGITGKPIMIQDVEVVKEVPLKLVFNDAVFDNQFMWFSAWFFDGVFKVDLQTKEIFYLGTTQRRGINNSCLYRNVVKVKEKIFFIPYKTNTIVEYNVNTSSFESYVLPIKASGDIPLFHSAFSEGDWIWMMPMAYHSILRFNVVSGETQIFDEWYEELRPYIVNMEGVFFRQSIKIDNCIWCPFLQGNIVMRFNLIDKKAKLYKVADESFSYRSIAFDGKNFWLMLKDQNTLIKWNEQSNDIRKYESILSQGEQEDVCFGSCIYSEGFIWIFPCIGKNIIKFDPFNEEVVIYDSYPENFIYEDKNSQLKFNYLDVKTENELIEVFPQRGNMMLRINGKTNATDNIELLVSPEVLYKIVSEDNIIQERNHYISLFSYVNFIVNKNDKRVEEKREYFKELLSIEEACGKKIHDTMISEIK